ncbi:serine protease, partial [Streptomyces tendae]
MTDSTRRSGADEPYPYAYGGGAGYPDPPAYQPQQPVTTPSGVTVWPGDGSASGGNGAGEDGGAFASEGAHGGGGRRRARVSRPVALIAAVAAVSALVGGGAAALVTNATQKSDTTVSTPVVNANSTSHSGVSAVAAAVSPSIVEVSASGTSGQSTGSGV